MSTYELVNLEQDNNILNEKHIEYKNEFNSEIENDYKNSKNSKNIKILIDPTKPYVYKNEINNLVGYEYDILKEFIKENKLKPEITYLDEKNKTESNEYYLNEVAIGNYDIFIGGWSFFEKRKEALDFSFPLHNDSNAVFFKSTNNVSTNYYWNITIFILQFLIIIIIFGFLLSIIHYVTSSYKTTFKESLWRTWAALLGEPGLGVNPTKFNDEVQKASLSNLTVRALIIFMSALFGVYLSAYVTSERVIESGKGLPFEYLKDLKNKSIILIKDSGSHDTLKGYADEYNINIIPVEGSYTGKTLIDFYNKNNTKMDIHGIFMAIEIFEQDNKNEFKKGSIPFPKGIGGALFNKNRQDLKLKFNETYFKLRSKDYIQRLCNHYFIRRNICPQ